MTRWVRLGEVVEPVSDAVPVAAAAEYRNVGVLNRGRGLFEKPALLGAQTRYATLYRIAAGDLLYSKLFAWEGAVTVVGEEHGGSYVSSEFPTYRPDGRVLDSGYLSHAVRWEGFVNQLRASASGLGQRRQRVNSDNFLKVQVPLPPLAEQRRIASHLDLLTRPTERCSAPSVEHLWGSLLANPPRGQRARLGELATSVSRPVSVDPDSTYPMAGVRWYGGGLFERERQLGSGLAARTVYEVHPGDLVYNRLFAWKQSFALADEESPAFVSNEFPTFRVDDTVIDPAVLHYLLLTTAFTADVNDASTGSTPTSRNRLKVHDFLALEVEVPCRSSQPVLREVLARIKAAQVLERRKQALAAALLPAARNGIFNSMR